jgi:hypothetical protein
MTESQFKRFGLPAGPSVGNSGRAGHLETLAKFRAGDAPKRPDLGFGAVALSIPELDYYVLLHRFPDLASPDGKTKDVAWKKFARDAASLPYRVKAPQTRIRK